MSFAADVTRTRARKGKVSVGGTIYQADSYLSSALKRTKRYRDTR